MRSTTLFSLLAAGLALLSREETTFFFCRCIKLTSLVNQNHQQLTLHQFRLELTQLGKSVGVGTQDAG